MTVLGGLALPLMAGNPTHARQALCLDNLRVLGRAFQLYAVENEWYPPNPDDGNTTPGFNWVPGQAGIGGGQEFNSDILTNSRSSLLANYLDRRVEVWRCPEDRRRGLYQGADPERKGSVVAAARSVALNLAVGVNPYQARGKTPTDGAWLDNAHSHTSGKIWRTYGKPEHIVAPSPSSLATILEEDPASLNDGMIAFGMQTAEWIDWPATHHDMGGTLAFADGHSEAKRWEDPRTMVVRNNVARRAVPGSPDYAWLRERISARLEK